MGRASSRKHAFYLIFQIPFHEAGFDVQAAAQAYIAEQGIGETDAAFTLALVDGTTAHLLEIDALISERAEWGFERISSVDLAVLRLAIFEVLYHDSVPVSVAINEAVTLAKDYGTDDSGVFVNGLLAQVAKRKTEAAPHG